MATSPEQIRVPVAVTPASKTDIAICFCVLVLRSRRSVNKPELVKQNEAKPRRAGTRFLRLRRIFRRALLSDLLVYQKGNLLNTYAPTLRGAVTGRGTVINVKVAGGGLGSIESGIQ